VSTLLIRNAGHVETFDDAERVLQNASIFVRDEAIEAIGPAAELPQSADRVVDASGCIVIPGLVNTPGPCPARKTPNSSIG